MANILIIDDDKMLCEMMCRYLGDLGHNVVYALTLKEGMIKAVSEDFDVVFLDVCLPDGDGLEALPKIKEVPSIPEVIIFTGEGDPDGAELAITSGAWDYIEKPPSMKQMTLPLARALQYRDEKSKRESKMDNDIFWHGDELRKANSPMKYEEYLRRAGPHFDVLFN